MEPTEETPAKVVTWGGKRAGSGRKRAPGESYEAARRRKESALADLRQLEVQTLRGERLVREDVLRERTEAYRRVRSGMLAVPSRVRARLPHLSAQDAIVLDEEIRAALQGVGSGEDTAAC